VQFLSTTCLGLFVASIALSILRHHLWDLDVIVNVSLVYGILTALVGAVFVLVVTLTGRVVDGEATLWPSLVALAVFGVFFAPLRARVQEGVDRILYGARRDPYRVLTLLAERLDSPEEADVVLREAAEAVASASLRLDYVAITRLQGDGTVSVGTARTAAASFVLRHHDVEIGRLDVAHRPGSPMGQATRGRLTDLAERLAGVVHAVDVSEAVRRSRQALAAAREEERRRVRRDLHDGLGPAMAAVALKVDAARMMLDRDPVRAREVLVQLGADIRETITDVRRLVYDLQPPVLDSAGLLAALADRVAAFDGRDARDARGDGAALRVELEAPDDLGDLPGRVELAAYRIVCEALTNVTRHAEATRCRVIVASGTGQLRLTVDDNGRGLVEPVQVGIGTASMMERAAALGGRCRLGRSPLGGTRVEVSLPLDVQDVPDEVADTTQRPAPTDISVPSPRTNNQQAEAIPAASTARAGAAS
jgi:signal transduction histidine kinase